MEVMGAAWASTGGECVCDGLYGRGGGISYCEGPDCSRMWTCERASIRCSSLYTGRLSSTRMFHLLACQFLGSLPRRRRLVRVSDGGVTVGLSACVTGLTRRAGRVSWERETHLKNSRALALRRVSSSRVFINLPQLRLARYGR